MTITTPPATSTPAGSRVEFDSASQESVVATFDVVQLAPDTGSAALSDGSGSVHYSGGTRPEDERFGPSALAVSSDGIYWVLDVYGSRIARMGPNGAPLDPVALPDEVRGAADLAVVENAVFLLDTTSIDQAIVEMDRAGRWRRTFPLPTSMTMLGEEPAIRASGLLVTPDGDLLVELESGAAHFKLDRETGTFAPQQQVRSGGVVYETTAPPDPLSGPPMTPMIRIGGQVVEDHQSQRTELRSTRLIGLAAGDVYLEVTRARPDESNRIELSQVIERRDGETGALVGTSPLDVDSRYTYVSSPVEVSQAGEVYLLRTGRNVVEVVALGFQPGSSARGHESVPRPEPIAFARPATLSLRVAAVPRDPWYCASLLASHMAT